MPAKKDAEYYRNYRARKSAEALTRNADLDVLMAEGPVAGYARRIAELEEEVRQLKRQLAMRASPIPSVEQWKAAGGPTVMHEGKEMIIPASLPRSPIGGGFGVSRPAPKPGKKG